MSNIHRNEESIRMVAEHYANEHQVAYTVIKKGEFFEFVRDSYFENHKDGFEIIERYEPTTIEPSEFDDAFNSLSGEKFLEPKVFQFTNPYAHLDEVKKNKSKTLHVGYTHVKSEPTIGRNEPCNCGSGKKYKKCCIK